jgi:mRNA interferase HigB
MRLIAKKRLIEYWQKHPDTEQPLKAWADEVATSAWKTPQDIKRQHASASFLMRKRWAVPKFSHPPRGAWRKATGLGALLSQSPGRSQDDLTPSGGPMQSSGIGGSLANNRVVFNIKGNAHRLIVALAYRLGAVYIKFIGTHAQYDKIDATTVETE